MFGYLTLEFPQNCSVELYREKSERTLVPLDLLLSLMEDKIQEHSGNADRSHHLISNSMTYIPVLDISLNLFSLRKN